VLSGILEDQVEPVIECFSSREFAPVEKRADKEWRALLFKRRERDTAARDRSTGSEAVL
jgi:ribosomal protein L11 methylase PrmA